MYLCQINSFLITSSASSAIMGIMASMARLTIDAPFKNTAKNLIKNKFVKFASFTYDSNILKSFQYLVVKNSIILTTSASSAIMASMACLTSVDPIKKQLAKKLIIFFVKFNILTSFQYLVVKNSFLFTSSASSAIMASMARLTSVDPIFLFL